MIRMFVNIHRVKLEPEMGLHKYQGAQQVHEAFVPAGPGSKACNHRLIVDTCYRRVKIQSLTNGDNITPKNVIIFTLCSTSVHNVEQCLIITNAVHIQLLSIGINCILPLYLYQQMLLCL